MRTVGLGLEVNKVSRVELTIDTQHASSDATLAAKWTRENGQMVFEHTAMMAPEGVECISLGPQTPLEDIRRAAIAHKAHIVALSFSAAFPVRQATDGLATLRRQLPAHVTLWAGGEMTRRVRKTLTGTVLLPDLAATLNALRSWRSHWVQQPA